MIKQALQRTGELMYNWMEGFVWCPLSLLFIALTIQIHFYMTGRPSTEDPWAWLVDFAPRIFAVVIAIVFTSVSRESFGSWLNKKEKLSNPIIASVQNVCSTALCLGFLYFLSH